MSKFTEAEKLKNAIEVCAKSAAAGLDDPSRKARDFVAQLAGCLTVIDRDLADIVRSVLRVED